MANVVRFLEGSVSERGEDLIADNTFIILDERTVHDETCSVVSTLHDAQKARSSFYIAMRNDVPEIGTVTCWRVPQRLHGKWRLLLHPWEMGSFVTWWPSYFIRGLKIAKCVDLAALDRIDAFRPGVSNQIP